MNLNNNSLFTFYLSKNVNNPCEFENTVAFGDYLFCYDSCTPIQYSFVGNKGVIILGLAVNLKNGKTEDLAEDIIESCTDIFSVIEYEEMLGGKYVVFFRDEDRYYCLPDATGSIPVFYSNDRDNGMICSSHSQQIVNYLGLHKDKELLKIRQSGDISQAMPYDVTEYKEILQLLPNHFIDFSGQKAVRFINQAQKKEVLSAARAAEITAPLIQKLTRFYISKFNCYCPITGGRDSRVVLASMQNAGNEKVDCYTIKHDNHTDSSPDLLIPLKLCDASDINYKTITDEKVDDELKVRFNKLLGENRYSQRTLMIANTIHSNFGGSAVINGDIIGQVGKCSLHRDIPECFATAGYFRCKLHNYSKGAKKMLSCWLSEIKNSKEKVNTFDLFSIENRMGRWAAQENIVYNTSGQLYLNIFNSRSIIYVWTLVDRKERKNSLIHTELIKLLNKDLLKVEFEQDKGFLTRFSKSNGIVYYLFSYLKFWYQRMTFLLKR